MFGIEGIQIYFPKTYVDQQQFEKFNKVSPGKYTNGLGQHELSFAYPFEDVNSLCLTVVSRLMKNYNIHPSQVGRIEVGTETLVDKSKSSKTVLMQLFKGFHDIEGATSINACYGAMNALINTMNWITSSFWNGKYGIVVASDLAVYEKGPARCTGGAGAVAILIGPNAKITFNKQRASFMDNRYDFYKPNPSKIKRYTDSQYPIVDGKISINCYLQAVENCYNELKKKLSGKNILQETDYFCFHSPFYKMVQKAFTKLAKTQNEHHTQKNIEQLFIKKVHPCMQISQKIGNIYTGSIFSTLIGLLISGVDLKKKNLAFFSYGSGVCSTLMTAKVHDNILTKKQIEQIKSRLSNRIKISPEAYDLVMSEREKNYGYFQGILDVQMDKLDDQTYYLSEIDEKWRRKYQNKNSNMQIALSAISFKDIQRLGNIDKRIPKSCQKFYKMSIQDRMQYINSKLQNKVDPSELISGGLKLNVADSMTENVIGLLSLPLSVVPEFVINHKQIMIPMCIQEPSVVAACSSIGKFIAPYSFFASSTPSIMIGQIHLPDSQAHEINTLLSKKYELINILNSMCLSMVKRGGGVTDIRSRQIGGMNSKQYVLDISVDVRDAMGANIVNTLCERAKQEIIKLGIYTGIAILSNYCTQRRAIGWFEIPTKIMGRKGYQGLDVANKIMQAYDFAKKDVYRAATHNKGIMNGIDSVCLATGQDWRAVEASSHTFASRNNKYMPLTHYQLVLKNGEMFFKGILELPIAVGSQGGVISKNPLYKSTMQILGNPSAQKLSQILVCVGLAQNFAALRALAIQGIQKGHMKLHARTLARKVGIPDYLLNEACEYMTLVKKYDQQSCLNFLQNRLKPKL